MAGAARPHSPDGPPGTPSAAAQIPAAIAGAYRETGRTPSALPGIERPRHLNAMREAVRIDRSHKEATQACGQEGGMGEWTGNDLMPAQRVGIPTGREKKQPLP